MKKIIIIAISLLAIQNFAFSKTVLTIATASNFASPLKKIVELFEKQNSDTEIKISSGASGILANQISSGAPFDIFFSADKKYIDILEKENKILPRSSFNFAKGKLVIWSPNHKISNYSLKEIKKLLISSKDPIALADAAMAPFGAAANEFLKKSFENNGEKPKYFIYGRNIEQTANFISIGSAPIGFISLSSIAEFKNKGEYWVVPQNLYAPIIQKAGIIKQSKQIKTAEKFFDFFKNSDAVNMIISNSGYSMDLNRT